MSEAAKCPRCGCDCVCDEVDVGVVYGPWRCLECGWSADEEEAP